MAVLEKSTNDGKLEKSITDEATQFTKNKVDDAFRKNGQHDKHAQCELSWRATAMLPDGRWQGGQKHRRNNEQSRNRETGNTRTRVRRNQND